jgi:predicted RNase H-like nuclease (RuvC/YqgF family)
MKSKIKVIAALVSSIVFTGSVAAQEEKGLSFLNQENSVQHEIVNTNIKSQDTQTHQMTQSSTQPLEIQKYRQAEAFIDPAVSAERSKQLSERQHTLELSKLRMAEANIEDQITDLEMKRQGRTIDSLMEKKQVLWEKEKLEIQESHDNEIKSLRSDIDFLRKKLSNKNDVNDVLQGKIFVTQVSGIGHNIKARVYFDNNIATRSVGDEVLPGAVIERIEPSGLYVKYKKEQRFIPITTTQHAHFKTFGGGDHDLPPEMNGLAKELASSY